MIYILVFSAFVLSCVLAMICGAFSKGFKNNSNLLNIVGTICIVINIVCSCGVMYVVICQPEPYCEHISFEPYVIDGNFYIENGDGGFTALNLNNYDVCCGDKDKYIIEYDKITYRKDTSLEYVDNRMHNIVVYYPKEIFENVTK